MTKVEGSMEKTCLCGKTFIVQKYIPYFGSLSPSRQVIVNNGKVEINDYCSPDCVSRNGKKSETPIPSSNSQNKSG